MWRCIRRRCRLICFRLDLFVVLLGRFERPFLWGNYYPAICSAGYTAANRPLLQAINHLLVYVNQQVVYSWLPLWFSNGPLSRDCVMFVLKGILRAESQEKILIYLLLRQTGYAKNIAEFYGAPTNPIQKQLLRLEEDGVVVGNTLGKLKQYQLNPRYPFMEPLKALLKKALDIYPPEMSVGGLIQRTRPRKSGKPLQNLRK